MRPGHMQRRRNVACLRGLGFVLAITATLACTESQAAADCSVSVSGVAFGNYDPLVTSATDSTGDVVVVCTHVSGGATQVNYTVTLSMGSSGTYAPRRLRSGAATLNYNLYSTAARTTVWGSGSAGTVRVSGSMTVNPGGNRVVRRTHTIYGRIPAMQGAGTGDFTDTIVVTLTF